MKRQGYTDREEAFIAQSEGFRAAVLKKYPHLSDGRSPELTSRPPRAIPAVSIADYRSMTAEEISAIADQYHSGDSVSYFKVENPWAHPIDRHPIHDIATQLGEALGLCFPIEHPLEQHNDAIMRFGPPDGTVKIYDHGGKGGALSNQNFALHQDGLGNCGDVEAVILYAQRGPAAGGRTYFVNLVLAAFELSLTDPDAFKALFLPDAITVFRTTGFRKIKITGPVLSLYNVDEPQAFFRKTDAEYVVTWRDDTPAIVRARAFVDRFTAPLSYASSFVDLSEHGYGCLNHNRMTVHGRLSFNDNPNTEQVRLLSRKWFSSSKETQEFKHVPTLRILGEYSSLYPETFWPDPLEGEWAYDESSGTHIRVGQ